MSAIGTPIRGTLFYVEWSYRTLTGAADSPESMKRGEQYVVSADPSGGDLYEVTRTAVLGSDPRTEARDFSLVHSKRCCEIRGRAITAGGSN